MNFLGKFVIFTLGILIWMYSTGSIGAISNWTQTVWKNNIYGIFSTNKANLDTIPTVVIHPDGRLWVWLTTESTITAPEYRSGDIIAKRFCFENDKKECVSTFQQSVSWNTKFNIAVRNDIALNTTWTQYTDDQKKKWEPFYIRLNKNTLDTIWMANDQVSNWFTIWTSYAHITNLNLRSFWVQEGDTFSPKITETKSGHYVENENEKFVLCHLIHPLWWIVTSYNITSCSQEWKVHSHSVCNITTNACGIPRAEFRLAHNAQACEEYDYYPYLAVLTWWNVENTNIKSIPYVRNNNTSTFSSHPTDCRSWYTNIQMRFRFDWWAHYPAQSLLEFSKNSWHIIKIVDFWNVTLQ